MAPVPLRLTCFLAILLCCSDSASSSPVTDEQLNAPTRPLEHYHHHHHRLAGTTRYSFPRRLLVSNSASSFSSPIVLSASPQPHQKSTRRTVLWFVELLAGMMTGLSLGAAVGLRFAAILAAEEEKKPPLVFGYTVFDPELIWAHELSFLGREELETPSVEIIGRGACGEVYKAEIPNSDGAVVAIKRVDQPAVGAAQLCREDKRVLDKRMRQIRSEIMTAGFLRHPNILPLLAHVYRNDRHYLVYEYMWNGSLHDALKGAAAGTRELPWPARFKIARGVAAGLEYLHIVHRPAVIHRDLKPANILLDDNMEARISDFGLAKEAAGVDDGLTTTNVAGTIGYIAPEYYQVMRFTDKCDVYSFGVILAVLVTGRQPTDRFFETTDEMCLVGWLRNAMRSEDPTSAIDRKLRGKGYVAQMVLALKVACFCTYDNPGHRPNMRDVRCMLSQIKH